MKAHRGRRLVGATALLAAIASMSSAVPVSARAATSTSVATATAPAERTIGGRAGQDPDGTPRPFVISPEARATFDAIFDVATPSSCLSITVRGAEVYRRNGDQPVVPASTQKVMTGVIALDKLGSDTTFETKAVGTMPVAGVISGDVTLVGGGDPLLATDAVIKQRDLKAEYHPTRLDALADAIRDAGVTRIDGRIVGDESRYDQERAVASWPTRFVDQEQSGPLSALSVNDGYDWTFPQPDKGERRRSAQPAVSAAAALTQLLRDRSITVSGEPAAGTAPAGAETLASITSAKVSDIVDEMLLTSDNQTAELLVKELGHRAGAGTTDAGVGVMRARLAELGLSSPATVTLDGSGLDPNNRVTCDDLVHVLDYAGGPDSAIGRGLPIAGETGTLRNRFTTTDVKGLLRAKTGRLNGVSSLAGYIPLASGEDATFSFVVNDLSDEHLVQLAQEFMATTVHDAELPCVDADVPFAIPGTTFVGPIGTLSAAPLPMALVPAVVVPTQLLERRQTSLLDPCLATDEDFGIVLISP